MTAPVEGANPAAPADADNVEVDDVEVTPPAATEWWKFEDKDKAQDWLNAQITKRLAREKKTKIDPVAAERDTLKAEVERLKPFEAATQSDSEKRDARIAELEALVGPLQEYQTKNERANLARSIADEIGLPASFIPRIQGTDEDSIREDAQALLDALSESGSTPAGPKPKAPKESKKKDAEKLHAAGGSDGDDDDNIEDILAKVTKRNGNPFQLNRR